MLNIVNGIVVFNRKDCSVKISVFISDFVTMLVTGSWRL